MEVFRIFQLIWKKDTFCLNQEHKAELSSTRGMARQHI